MRTTINVSDDIANEIFKLSANETKTAAINKALVDWVRIKKKEKLLSMRGKIDIEDNVDELRELDRKKFEDGI